jgi:protease-4
MKLAKVKWLSVFVVWVLVVSGPMCWANQAPNAPADQAAEAPAPAMVVHLHLTGELMEAPMADPFGLLGDQVISLKGLVEQMKQVAEDNKVKGVVLTFDGMSFGIGQLPEIRAAIARVKDAGKKVYVHTAEMDTFTYALLCSGSNLSVAPQSSLWLTGIYGQSLYIKTLLDKIGVQADILHIGDYKSAGEMLTRTEPSGPAADNVNWLLDSIYGSLVDMIAKSRNKTAEQVRDLIDHGPYLADDAMAKGLIDAVETQEAFLARVRGEFSGTVQFENHYGREKKPPINVNSPFAFFTVLAELMNPPKKPYKDAVALVYVEGTIVPGYGQASPFASTSGAFGGDIAKALEMAANDSSVKAVVMRVDSPGGSAEASDVILNATKLIHGHKPLIVSMGDVAASGGYYVSCGADTIFADDTTITASIGVVGGKLVTAGLWDKLGINWVGYKRGANSDVLSSLHPFDPSQRQTVQQYMEKVYDVFKNHVTQGRADKLRKPIDEIAGGRVYSGKQALDLGLVDQIGGLQSAIEYAASKASITDYEVRIVPEPKDFLTQLIEDYSGQGERPSDVSLSDTIGANNDSPLLSEYPALATALNVLRKTEPQRARSLYQALQRIELVRRENVILMTPYDMLLR